MMPPSEATECSTPGLSAKGRHRDSAAGVVGPNAVLQLIQPLREAGGDTTLSGVFSRARVFQYLQQPPLAMVPEEEAWRLFDATLGLLGADAGKPVLREAGAGTARYVMEHRIPGIARHLLRALPAPLATPLLLKAIQKNAWTFAGSGHCTTGRSDFGWFVAIENNPLATPECPWHVGVLEYMFRSLASARATVEHSACGARQGSLCRFEIRLR